MIPLQPPFTPAPETFEKRGTLGGLTLHRSLTTPHSPGTSFHLQRPLLTPRLKTCCALCSQLSQPTLFPGLSDPSQGSLPFLSTQGPASKVLRHPPPPAQSQDPSHFSILNSPFNSAPLTPSGTSDSHLLLLLLGLLLASSEVSSHPYFSHSHILFCTFLDRLPQAPPGHMVL